MFGTAYTNDPEHDLVVMFYMNMYKSEVLNRKCLDAVYRLAAASGPEAKASVITETVAAVE